MKPTDQHEITRLLHDWNEGDLSALEELVPKVSAELQRLAKSYLAREAPGHTLQPTALVNELFLRLVGDQEFDWRNRAHFFGFAATTMRHILVDHARSYQTAKRGSGSHKISLDEAVNLPAAGDVDLLALDRALKDLARLDERQARIVELRAFVGLSIEEAATVMEVSVATVSRSWASAKAWLFRELGRDSRS